MALSTYVVTRNTGFIPLGRQGENEALEIQFRQEPSAWLATCGTGTFALLHKRNTDKEAYPVAITVADNTVTWLVSSSDTAIAGVGECELQFCSGDVVVKSRKLKTRVLPSIGESGDVPEAYEGWVNKLLEEIEDMIASGSVGEHSVYKGSYTVTPTTEAQTLETANCLMSDDVSVKAIPYYEVSNETGNTVYIGKEL